MPEFRSFTQVSPNRTTCSYDFVFVSIYKMIKVLGILFVIFLPNVALQAQPYGNEWIDYGKTYYKFPVLENRFYRIPYATLNAYGLAGVPCEQFQLWREGKEVPIFTTVSSGPIPTTGYIEFVGQYNTGSSETDLYTRPEWQLTPERSFFFDTAWYFLTINPVGINKRFETLPNNAATTTLLPDSFYMQATNPLVSSTLLNGGDARQLAGSLIRSSSWDMAEGYSSNRFDSLRTIEYNLTGLRAFMGGPSLSLEYAAAGLTNINHKVLLKMNNVLIDSLAVPEYEARVKKINGIPITSIIDNTINFKFNSPTPTDANVVMRLNLLYPRQFYNNTQFPLIVTIPANTNGNHIRLAGLNNGATVPVLYDLTNLKRYVGIIKPDTSMFAINGSGTERTLVMGSQVANHLRNVAAFKVIQFTDFSKPENQGNYMIITHNMLRVGEDYVEKYRTYRSSFLGGGYKAKIYDIDELAEQFNYGVRKNPLCIRRFISFAIDKFAEKPKMVFLVGRGTNYFSYLRSTSNLRENLNTVPTFGLPCSDNLLATRNNLVPVPEIPIGRLSAVNPDEVKVYLQKVTEFEFLQKKSPALPSDNEWRKRVLHLIGGSDPYLADTILANYMNNYAKTVKAPLTGSLADQFSRINEAEFAKNIRFIETSINNGVGLLTYFGHSSSSSIDFNLGSPDLYTNTGGRYPVIIANGCKAGNIFDFITQRLTGRETTISDNFIFAPEKGSIAFVSNSDLGVLNYLNLLTSEWYKAYSTTKYGKTIGEIQREALMRAFIRTGISDFYNRCNIEQNVLHGDPAIVPFTGGLPDFAVEAQMMNTMPTTTLTEQDSVTLKVKYYNLGTAVTDSVWLKVEREMPDGTIRLLYAQKMKNVFNQDSITFTFGLKGLFEEGNGYLVARIDPGNDWQERDKDNNVALLPFNLQRRHITPVFPYNFSIINNQNIELKASTTNPVDVEALYTFQMDTTALFNSPLLVSHDTMRAGGIIGWKPDAAAILPNTVYYWRVSRQPYGFNENTTVYSFSYEPGAKQGFGQSHFYQHLRSAGNQIETPFHNFWQYKQRESNIYASHGIYQSSGTEDTHFSLTVNGNMNIYSACIGRSIIFNLFDSLTFEPVKNAPKGAFGSADSCAPGREYNFEFNYYSYANRKVIMDFIDSIPKGTYVAARLIVDPPYDSIFAKYWKADTSKFGSGKSLYHSLYNQGFYDLDSLDRYRTFFFMFRKGDSASYKPYSKFSRGLFDRVYASVFPATVDFKGSVTSPLIGPAKTWKEIDWNFSKGTETSSDEHLFDVQLWGKSSTGTMDLLEEWDALNGIGDISYVDASRYPYVQLVYHAKDKIGDPPTQLNHWKVYFEGLPDGAWSGNEYYSILKTTLKPTNDTLRFKLAFKNISNLLLDSTEVTLKLDDGYGNISPFYQTKFRRLGASDTVILSIDTIVSIPEGQYNLLIEANGKGNPQEEQYFNNKALIKLLVEGGALPLFGFTFDATRQGKFSALNWEAREEKISVFRIEHRAENDPNFKVISQDISAHNSLAQPGKYAWLHETPSKGVNYYRVRAIFRDGSEKLSATRIVTFDKGNIVKFAPNPFNRYFTLQPSDQSIKWQISIYDAAGKLVKTETGSGSRQVYLQEAANGLYWIHYSDGKTTEIYKIMKN